MLTEKAPQDLVALATLYYSTQVAGQARGTEEAKRRDISCFLAFYYDPFRHYSRLRLYVSCVGAIFVIAQA